MKLNYKKTICVGFAFFLISMFWQAYDTLVPKILTDKFGMAQTWSGAIMALDNVFALFLLPIFGALSDKLHSKHGRRTPFIFIGTILAVILLVFVSVPDSMQKNAIAKRRSEVRTPAPKVMVAASTAPMTNRKAKKQRQK